MPEEVPMLLLGVCVRVGLNMHVFALFSAYVSSCDYRHECILLQILHFPECLVWNGGQNDALNRV